MGYYIAPNELRKGLSARSSISLNTALVRFSNWDVFLSQKSDDAPKAVQIAERISANGLSVWVDVADPSISGDGPDLADYIRRVLRSSRSLLALITSATNESWWVPFEVGIAFDQKSHSLPSATEHTYHPSYTSGPTYTPTRNSISGAGNFDHVPQTFHMSPECAPLSPVSSAHQNVQATRSCSITNPPKPPDNLISN